MGAESWQRNEQNTMSLLPDQLGDFCQQLWKDCDLIRSDEHHRNQVYCDVTGGIAEVVEAMQSATSAFESPKLFLATLAADDPVEMVARGKHVLRMFGLLAPNCGFQLAEPLTSPSPRVPSVLEKKSEASLNMRSWSLDGRETRLSITVLALSFFRSSGSAKHGRGYTAFVHAKLARILGASSVLLETKVEETTTMSTSEKQERQELVSMLRQDENDGPVFEQSWEGMKQVLPVISGKIHPLQLPFFFESLGHSEVLVTAEVSASKRDSGPGLSSMRAAEEAWKIWHRQRGEMQDTLAEYLIEYARSWLRDQELEVHEFSLKYFKREYEIGFGKIMG
eukprot:symbB.v1.2.006206.t1/scaffold355.1/size243294/16